MVSWGEGAVFEGDRNEYRIRFGAHRIGTPLPVVSWKGLAEPALPAAAALRAVGRRLDSFGRAVADCLVVLVRTKIGFGSVLAAEVETAGTSGLGPSWAYASRALCYPGVGVVGKMVLRWVTRSPGVSSVSRDHPSKCRLRQTCKLRRCFGWGGSQGGDLLCRPSSSWDVRCRSSTVRRWLSAKMSSRSSDWRWRCRGLRS